MVEYIQICLLEKFSSPELGTQPLLQTKCLCTPQNSYVEIQTHNIMVLGMGVGD